MSSISSPPPFFFFFFFFPSPSPFGTTTPLTLTLFFPSLASPLASSPKPDPARTPSFNPSATSLVPSSSIPRSIPALLNPVTCSSGVMRSAETPDSSRVVARMLDVGGGTGRETMEPSSSLA